MTVRADPRFLLELQKYGTVNVEACFNCGNCTAVCPLSTEEASFPRRMIRYAQLGMRGRLLTSKELWLCYFCGECSQTCPRQAQPGDFMAAARKYAIARYDRLGLARLLYTSPARGLLMLVVLGIVLAGFMLTVRGPMDGSALRLFEFIPYWAIHDLGLAVIVIVFLAGLWGALTMVVQIDKIHGLPKGARLNWGEALWQALGVDALGQRHYRQDCGTGTATASPRSYSPADLQPVAEGQSAAKQSWYLQKWFLHAATMWGFLGLLAATILDYTLDILGVKPTGAAVPIWYPIRLLGTLAGLLLLYGTSMLIFRRLRRADEILQKFRFVGLDFPGHDVAGGCQRVRFGALALPAAGALVGLLGVFVPCDGGDGAGFTGPLHQICPCLLSYAGPVPACPQTPARARCQPACRSGWLNLHCEHRKSPQWRKERKGFYYKTQHALRLCG